MKPARPMKANERKATATCINISTCLWPHQSPFLLFLFIPYSFIPITSPMLSLSSSSWRWLAHCSAAQQGEVIVVIAVKQRTMEWAVVSARPGWGWWMVGVEAFGTRWLDGATKQTYTLYISQLGGVSLC